MNKDAKKRKNEKVKIPEEGRVIIFVGEIMGVWFWL